MLAVASGQFAAEVVAIRADSGTEADWRRRRGWPADNDDERNVDPARRLVEHMLYEYERLAPEAVLAWYEANLPHCFALVPSAHREEFLGGFLEAR